MNIGEAFYCSQCMRPLEEEGKCPFCGYDPSLPYQGPQLEEGTFLRDGRYQLGAVIGRGGFGITYAAWDSVLELPVAVKEYFPGAFCSRDVLERDEVIPLKDHAGHYQLGLQTFTREAHVLATLQNIAVVVKFFDCFEENGTAYIIMEYVRGQTLKDYCRTHALPVKKLLKLLRPTIDGLVLVHHSGVLHRDISPNNLMVQEDGTVKLIDFGAATSLEAAENGFALNRIFAAPEQYRPDGRVGPWTDVYGMAATLYTILSQESPLSAPERLKTDTIKEDWQPRERVSRRVRQTIFHSLALNPDRRPQTMEEFRAELYRLPYPLQTRKQKALYTVKVLAVVCLLEAGALGAWYCGTYKVPRQVQLALSAAVLGNEEAGYKLAYNYFRGHGGDEKFHEDLDKASYWYEWCIRHGSLDAAVDYAKLLEDGNGFTQDIPKAIEYLRIGEAAGDPTALNNMAIHYLIGDYVEQNVPLAIDYFTRAAQAGIPIAMTNLGAAYRDGVGCEKDPQKAFSYFQMAAQQDEPLGTLCLGECYYEGIGVEKNTVKYLEYAYRAATLGSDEALFRLGEFYRTELMDYQEAMYFYRLLMDRNIGEGYYGAAILYRDGLGVEADPYEASINMFTAELLGCEEAAAEFDRMNGEGYGIFKKENRTAE